MIVVGLKLNTGNFVRVVNRGTNLGLAWKVWRLGICLDLIKKPLDTQCEPKSLGLSRSAPD